VSVFDAQGWHGAARRAPSPFFDERPPIAVDLLVVHAISLPPDSFGSGDVQRFFMGELDFDRHPYYDEIRHLRVSAHFFIPRDGALWQHVGIFQRAWHAGQSQWEGRPACNDYSIGVELEGTATQPFTPEQYRTLGQLGRDLQTAFPALSRERVVGHADIAPDRKWDPGPCFSWKTLWEEWADGR
jgi:AmpD protein